MDKNHLLEEIKIQASLKNITLEEVSEAFNQGAGTSGITNKHLNLAEVMYYIGGFIVFLGISMLLWQNWELLPSVTRILVTLGSGLAALGVGVLLSNRPDADGASQAFYLIFNLVTPVGIGITFHEAGLDVGEAEVHSMMASIAVLLLFPLYVVFKKPIFIIFLIVHSTWLFFSLTGLLFGSSPAVRELKLNEYRVLMTGITYTILGYYFSKNQLRGLTDFLYAFGSLFFLGAAMVLGGWKPSQNIFWEFVFPFLVGGIMYLSVNLKSRAFLAFGTFFLMAYILKITAEYFSDSLGWPLALVMAGLGLIGIGYYSLQINRKYLTNTTQPS